MSLPVELFRGSYGVLKPVLQGFWRPPDPRLEICLTGIRIEEHLGGLDIHITLVSCMIYAISVFRQFQVQHLLLTGFSSQVHIILLDQDLIFRLSCRGVRFEGAIVIQYSFRQFRLPLLALPGIFI